MDAPPPASPPPGAPPPGYPPPGYYPSPPPGYGHPPPKKSSLLWLWILLGVVGGVMVLGILAAVAIPSFVEYQQKAKRPEAQLMLTSIGRAARTHFYETSTFPTQASGPTPSRPCCEFPDHKCPVDPSAWAVEPWLTLGVEPYAASYFQYAYTPGPNGITFTATATGDLDCDGTTVVYTLRGNAIGGDPVLDVIEQPTNRD